MKRGASLFNLNSPYFIKGAIKMDEIALIINDWDPANLMSHAPDDEYSFEITEIKKAIKEQNDLFELAQKIRDVMIQSFGSDMDYSFEKYHEVAVKILGTV